MEPDGVGGGGVASYSSIWDGSFKSTLEIACLSSLGGNACYDSGKPMPIRRDTLST